MSDDTFELNPDAAVWPTVDRTDAAPLYETANRTQVELTPTHLETLLPPGHAARLVWRFVEGVDLRRFYEGLVGDPIRCRHSGMIRWRWPCGGLA